MGCRLLYVIGDLTSGGAEYQLYLLLKTMDRDRFCPQVVVWSFCERDPNVSLFAALGISLHCFPRALSVFAKIRRLRHLIRRLNPQVVHSYSFYLNCAVHCATVYTATSAIGSVRSDFLTDKSDSGLLLGSVNARWPRNQICNSLIALEHAKRSRSPFTPQRLLMIRNGLDLSRLSWSPIPVQTNVCILGIGSLIPLKRWDRLLEAAAELKTRQFDFSVRIVGDGPLRQALEGLTRSLKVDDRVHFVGQSDDIPGLLAGSSILAHTSDVEGCPNVVMEAMASGRPVVTTDAGDAPFLVEDGKTGFVVRRGDAKGLVDSLTALIRDPALRQQMGEAGRAKAVREFSLDRLVSETLSAYEAVGWRP